MFDSGSVEGTVFYVMPYVEGESLRARLRREMQLPVADALRITTEIATGLSYAHRHGVIHRDIKPDNVDRREDVRDARHLGGRRDRREDIRDRREDRRDRAEDHRDRRENRRDRRH